jgi:hypothetical protein
MPVTANPKPKPKFPSTVPVKLETRALLKELQRAYRMRDGANWTQSDVLAAIVAAEAERIGAGK